MRRNDLPNPCPSKVTLPTRLRVQGASRGPDWGREPGKVGSIGQHLKDKSSMKHGAAGKEWLKTPKNGLDKRFFFLTHLSLEVSNA